MPNAVAPSPSDPRERELKFDVAREDLAVLADRLAGTPGAVRRARTAKLLSTYFDTADHALGAAGVTLRVRREGRWRVQTLKQGEVGAGVSDRLERERRVYADGPALDAEEAALVEAVVGRAVKSEELGSVVTTRVRRTVFDVTRDDAAIEVALDDADVEGGGRTAAFSELELEFKRGDPAALFVLARELAAHAPLRLGTLSKSARGFRLAEAESPGAVSAGPSPVRADMDVATAAVAVLAECVRQFRRNEDALLAGGDDKAVHQARVGLRRLRSALKIFRPALSDARLPVVAGEIKWLGQALGAARDLDVFAESALDGAGRHVDVGPLAAEVETARTEAYAVALEALRSPRARAALFDLAEWMAIGAWRTAPETAAVRGTAIEAFAAEVLAARFAKFEKKAKGLVRLSPEKRHDARIEAKALRYAAGFFAPLYQRNARTERRFERFDRRLKKLLDTLGALNDIATAGPLALRIGHDAVNRGEAALGLAAGVIAGSTDGRAHAPLADADRRLRKLRDAKIFWE
ncbi:CYTH and CHAD domain-containing protein [Methylopila sp. 73B]|uniref:CYTH and CHAD domain-containing protein n=1 Tax=Methylopila sp. 73B TaxID=1120792 RepID=UPI0003720C54|nr:CYTH and CHAD domain-containing protein [Methylopila sp. 73B]